MASPRIALIVGIVLSQAVHLMGCGPEEPEPVPAPPALYQSLESLPAKNIVQILAEEGVTATNLPPQPPDEQQLQRDFAEGPSRHLVKKMDQLLVAARLHYNGPDTVNLLHDLHDLAASDATAEEASDYVKWRLDHLDSFAAAFDEYGSQMRPSEPPDLKEKTANSSREMLPFWLYLNGALCFRQGNDTDSEAYFDRVLNEFPDSPRAEPALFMKARCRLSKSVDASAADSIMVDARQLFLDYLAKYPRGRYRNDVLGWLGDNCSSTTSEALTYFIEQAEDKNHPENFSKAIEMISGRLADMTGNTDLEFDKIAQHPTVAFALACAALNNTPRPDPNGYVDNQWRLTVLRGLGRAVLDHNKLYKGSLRQNRYLAILAHAASDEGDQKKALQIVAMGDKAKESDDLAFVYPLALQRANKLEEAVTAYRDFLKRFPNSPLAKGAQYRLALALHDQKKDGDALLALVELTGNHLPVSLPPPAGNTNAPAAPPRIWWPPSPLQVNDSGATADAVNQTLDTLLNFAPISALQTALTGTDPEHETFRKELRMVLKERSLAAENFGSAASFAESDAQKQQFLDQAKQVEEFKKTSGAEAAQKGIQIADFWATETSNSLKLPLDFEQTQQRLFNDDWTNAGSIRTMNARALNFDYAASDQEMEGRIPWFHSITWNQNVTKSDPTGEFAPQALWKLIQARRKFAEFSSYGFQQSVQTDAGTLSHQEYDTLLKKYPDSIEANKYAAYWSFNLPIASPNDSSDESYYRPDLDRSQSLWKDALADYPDLNQRPQWGDTWDAICGKLVKLPERAKNLDQKAFASEVNKLVEAAKPSANAIERMALMNCLDDLQQLSQVPNLAPGIRDEYIKLRYRVMNNAPSAEIPDVSTLYPQDQAFDNGKINTDATDLSKKPGSEPIRDFIEFLNLAITANQRVDIKEISLKNSNDSESDEARDFVAMASQAESFLGKYPKSPKREAARVLQLRGLVLAARPMNPSYHYHWPESVSRSGEDECTFYHQAPLDRDAYEKALKAYYEEFPHGMYPNAVLSYRADEALMTSQWGEALDALVALHSQNSDLEFQDQVTGELSYLFDQLDKDELRNEVLQEILKRPAARTLLQTYITCGGLPYLKDYLIARLMRA